MLGRIFSILLLACAFSSAATIEVHQFDSPEQELLFRQLTKELRCPKCQNNNIADSNAPLAQDLREKTYQMLKSGKTKQQVLDYMVARYGNFVRYDPPLTPAVLSLWLSPLLVIVLGGLLLWRLSRRQREDHSLSLEQQQRLAELSSDQQEPS